MSHPQSHQPEEQTMPITITTTWIVDGLDDLHMITRALSEVAVVPVSTEISGQLVDRDPDYEPVLDEFPSVREWRTLGLTQDQPHDPASQGGDHEPHDDDQSEADDDDAALEHDHDDDTPAFGIERPDYNVRARETYLATLVAWTHENITDGPLARIDTTVMACAYRRMLTQGVDCRLNDFVTNEMIACLRGAFRDATAGQVPA
jgi:hypothetical protein